MRKRESDAMADEMRWTVVQHSGFGYKADPAFRGGLETRLCVSKSQQERVRAVGGVLFDTYSEAEEFAEAEMYPPGLKGLIPRAPGTFSRRVVDGLRIYVPLPRREVKPRHKPEDVMWHGRGG